MVMSNVDPIFYFLLLKPSLKHFSARYMIVDNYNYMANNAFTL